MINDIAGDFSSAQTAAKAVTLPAALKRILNLLPHLKAHETFTDRF
jgi:hypothetical protein